MEKILFVLVNCVTLVDFSLMVDFSEWEIIEGNFSNSYKDSDVLVVSSVTFCNICKHHTFKMVDDVAS